MAKVQAEMEQRKIEEAQREEEIDSESQVDHIKEMTKPLLQEQITQDGYGSDVADLEMLVKTRKKK